MDLLGGWWGVAGVTLVALFFIREVIKYMRGDVDLSARQKVVRVLGGAFLMAVLLMILFLPAAMDRPDLSRAARNVWELGYLGTMLALAVLTLLMAVMDLGEVSRQFTRARRDIRASTLTQEDIDRLIAAERKDHPDEIGRHRENDER